MGNRMLFTAPSPIAIIERHYEALRKQDIVALMACCTDDIVYAINRSGPDQTVRRVYRGSFEVSSVLLAITGRWEFLEFTPENYHVDAYGCTVRELTHARARHRTTGRIYEGSKRHIWHIRGGLIAVCEEFEDTGFIDAFLRMTEGD